MVCPDHGAFTNLREGVQYCFDIVGINIQTVRCHDDVLLAATEVEPPFGIDLAKVAGMKPVAIGSGDVLASHKNLPIGRDLYILTFENFSDRTCARTEGMIDCNNHARFRQAIS